MRKAYVTKTVLQCPEAWRVFCESFPTAMVAEDIGNKEVLIVYSNDKEKNNA